MKPKQPLSEFCKGNGKPTIYIYPHIRQTMLRLWSYPALRAAFDHSKGSMRDDIAAEMARRGGDK